MARQISVQTVCTATVTQRWVLVVDDDKDVHPSFALDVLDNPEQHGAVVLSVEDEFADEERDRRVLWVRVDGEAQPGARCALAALEAP